VTMGESKPKDEAQPFCLMASFWGGLMDFQAFFARCQSEPSVSDFESYLAYRIFEKRSPKPTDRDAMTLEMYSFIRDQAFERRDERAARFLYDIAGASAWKEGEWEGALR